MTTLRKLRVLYQTEAELLWRWRLGRRALIKRGVVSLLASLLAFLLTSWLLPGLFVIVDLGSGLGYLGVVPGETLHGVDRVESQDRHELDLIGVERPAKHLPS